MKGNLYMENQIQFETWKNQVEDITPQEQIDCLRIIELNISNICNLKCPFCPQSKDWNPSRDFMSLDTVIEISKQLKISESRFYYHLKKHGADNIDEVIKTIKELNYLYTDLEGRRFKSLKALCFANKINYYTVLNYTRRRGFPLDKAIKRLQNSKRTYLAKSKSL